MRNCFFYIHQNPLNAGLVDKIEDWPYSSFLDYAGLRNGSLCNKELVLTHINFELENFYQMSYAVIEEKALAGLC